jgi:hypothetical protein
MESIKLRWTGTRPLIMSNPQTVQLTNEYSVESRRLQTLSKAARKKQAEDQLVDLEAKQRKNDFESSAYWADGNFFLPDTVIMAVMKESARSMKKGKDIDRAVLMSETEAIIKTRARFKSLEEAFDDEGFRLEGPAKVPPKTGALIWKCRCMIPSAWSIDFTLEYAEEQVTRTALVEISRNAGALVGVGGWRPKFGRFTSEEVKQ